MIHSFSFTGSFSRSKFVDIFLTTTDGSSGGHMVSAHRVVLAAVSDKLGSICVAAVKDREVVIPGLKFEILVKIVEFIYTGRVFLEEATEVKDFKEGMNLLEVKLSAEQADSIGRSENFEQKSINSPEVFENGPKSILESDLNLSSDSSIVGDENGMDDKMIGNLNLRRFSDSEKDFCDSKIVTEDKDALARSVDKSSEVFQNSFHMSGDASDSESECAMCPPLNSNNIPANSPAKENVTIIVDEKPRQSKVKCPYCKQMFKYSYFMTHCIINHEREANFAPKQCEFCGQNMAGCIMDFHKLIFHGGQVRNFRSPINEVKVTCTYCGKKLCKGNMSRHIKAVHEMSKVVSKEKFKESKKSKSIEKENVKIKVIWREKSFTLMTRPDKPFYKGMRRFGEKIGVDVKLLMFKHRSQELKGCELARKFEGEEIEVMMMM